jgi:hypothetical protein
MDTGEQVTQYLEEVAQVLLSLHVQTPFHILIAGGAYMLLQKQRRSTEDIDFATVTPPAGTIKPRQVFRITVLRTEVARNTVPHSAEFKQAVRAVARKHPGLPDDWLNDEAAVYYYDDAPEAEVVFWRTFGGILYVYLPTQEYMLATKIAAFRPKDERDIRLLIRALGIRTREEAQAIVDKFLLPDAQEFWEVEEKLDILFP